MLYYKIAPYYMVLGVYWFASLLENISVLLDMNSERLENTELYNMVHLHQAGNLAVFRSRPG
jgi:hypothetical protein